MELTRPVPETAYFNETATINGIEMSVHWDETYNDYVIVLPQIVGGEYDVADQVIRLGNSPGIGKQIFDYASKLTQEGEDVHEIYKAIKCIRFN